MHDGKPQSYSDAVRRENEIRDAAFLNLTTDICGIKIRQMTPQDFLILDGLDLLIDSGEVPGPKKLVKFLWFLSTGKKTRWRQWLFAWRCRNWVYRGDCVSIYALVALRNYLTRTFQDWPGGGSSGVSYAGWCAYLIDNLASEYGWPAETIMAMPFRILCQQIACIKKRNNPKGILFNPSDKVTGERLRLKQARLDLVSLLARKARTPTN